MRNDAVAEGSENVPMSNGVCSVEVNFEFADLAFTLRGQEVGGKEFEDVSSSESRGLILDSDLG